MRIFFAQLFKLCTFILVTTIIVALGAPLENVIMTPTLKRDTSPICPKYKYSLCYTMGVMLVYCEDTSGNTISVQQQCDKDDICVEHYSPYDNLPHATCATYANCRIWNNFGNLYGETCSIEDNFKKLFNKEDLVIAVTTYSMNGNPIQVNQLDAFVDGRALPSASSMYNYSQMIQNYNYEKVKFCFTGGFDQEVVAYAIGWAYDTGNNKSGSESFNITSV